MEPYRTTAASDGPLRLTPPVPKARLAFGLAFSLPPLLSLAMFLRSGAPAPAAAFVAVFLVVGLGVAFGRRGAIVDKQAGTLTTWWGLWFPIRSKSQALSAASHVSLVRETRGSGKSKVVVYPVRLEPDAQEAIAPQHYVAARRMAEQLANYLGTGLRDASSGTLVVREAGALDEPLRSRLLRENSPIPAPASPPPARMLVRQQGDDTVIVVPPSGLGVTHVMSAAFSLVVAGVFATFLYNSRPPWFLLAFVLVPLAGPLVWSLLRILVALVGRTTVTCSQRGVSVRPWGPLRRTSHMSAETLEELFVVSESSMVTLLTSGSSNVLARDDQTTLTLGVNLSPEEAEWIRSAVCYAICTSMFGGVSRPVAG